jgi:hypothetical protein
MYYYYYYYCYCYRHLLSILLEVVRCCEEQIVVRYPQLLTNRLFALGKRRDQGRFDFTERLCFNVVHK